MIRFMTVQSFTRWFPLFVVALIGFLLLYQILWAPNKFDGDRVVAISKGISFARVADSLEVAGVIRNRKLFDLAGEVLGMTRQMHIGKYLFHSGMSNREILADLSTGKSAFLVPVIIREGLRVRTHARIFARDVGIDSARFAQLAFNPGFVRSLGIEANSLEGYLLPDTYLFAWQTDEEQIIRRMVEGFQRFYTDSLRRRERELGMTTNKVLALASIVEGEAILDSERTIIAGVYLNRLKKRMRLQADPTVQYIIQNGPRRLLYEDLRIESPYNTYRNYGLPPAPINNPGRASILAALYPGKHSFLYFVANGKGGHTFTRTYSDHQRAVSRFRRIRAQATAPQPASILLR